MGQESENSISDVIHCKGEFGHGKKVGDLVTQSFEVSFLCVLFIGNYKIALMRVRQNCQLVVRLMPYPIASIRMVLLVLNRSWLCILWTIHELSC